LTTKGKRKDMPMEWRYHIYSSIGGATTIVFFCMNILCFAEDIDRENSLRHES
jgi:hypothetical protein